MPTNNQVCQASVVMKRVINYKSEPGESTSPSVTSLSGIAQLAEPIRNVQTLGTQYNLIDARGSVRFS